MSGQSSEPTSFWSGLASVLEAAATANDPKVKAEEERKKKEQEAMKAELKDMVSKLVLDLRKDFETKLSRVEATNRNSEAELKKLSTELTAVKQQKTDMSFEVAGLKKENALLKSEVASLKQQKIAADRSNKDLVAKVELQGTGIQDMKEYIQVLKEDMEAKLVTLVSSGGSKKEPVGSLDDVEEKFDKKAAKFELKLTNVSDRIDEVDTRIDKLEERVRKNYVTKAVFREELERLD